MKTKFNINNDYADKGANTENISMQEIHFSDCTNFNAGGKCVFRNSVIHINENIVVKGEYGSEFDMEFKNCVIYYHERVTEKPLMEFYRKTALAFDHCTFIDCGAVDGLKYSCDFGRDFLFLACEAFSISFDDCKFENCSRLFSVNLVNLSMIDFTMRGSLLRNCKDLTYSETNVCGHHGVYVVSDCIFEGGGRIFSLAVPNNALDFYAYNNLCSDIDAYCYNVQTKGVNQIQNNTFVDSDFCIRRIDEVIDCMFINCNEAISECTDVKSCCFDNCRNTIETVREGGSVRYSRFVNSKGCILNATDGNVLLYADEFLGAEVSKGESVMFFTADDYDSKPSNIISCVFDDIVCDEGYIIDSALNNNRTESVIAEIRDCRFSNITTQRSDEKIINDKHYHDFLLWKNQEVEAVRECSGNRGIDEVNVKNAQPVSRERMDTNRLGIIIGSDLYSG